MIVRIVLWSVLGAVALFAAIAGTWIFSLLPVAAVAAPPAIAPAEHDGLRRDADGVSEAVRSVPAVIASAAKQSTAPRRKLDCFVAALLAMTGTPITATARR